MRWVDVRLDKALNLNTDETALRQGLAALENAHHSDKGGLSRFPGLEEFVAPEKLPGAENSRFYLNEWAGDLIAVTDTGMMFRVDQESEAENVTAVAIAGGRRPTFAQTEQHLLVAAGGPIVQFGGFKTEILSRDAPISTHVVFLGGRVIAIEPGSGRFNHTPVGQYDTWEPLDTFSAEGNPDQLTAAIRSDFSALILGGPQSIEQFDLSSSGTRPFFRRGDIGNGVFAPYTMISADQQIWAIDKNRSFARIAGAISRPVSDEIQRFLSAIDNWDEAWASEMIANGQAFILLQMPLATNRYGTTGVTLAFDYRKERWTELYGFNLGLGLPNIWPGCSVYPMWGQTFVGCRGRICRLSNESFWNDGRLARMGFRTGHFSTGNTGMDVCNVRLEARRGVGQQNAARPPVIRLRALKDGRGWSRWAERSMGAPGNRTQIIEFGRIGTCDTVQFEVQISDDCSVEIANLQILVKDLNR